MVKFHKDPVNWLLVLLTLVVLGASVVMLAWIEARYRQEMEGAIESTREAFARSGALRTPGELETSFQSIEDLAYLAQTSSRMVRGLFVAKQVRTADRSELVLLHPFYHAAQHPQWARELARLRQVPVAQDGEQLGILYFDLDRRPLRGVQIIIGATVGLIVLLLTVLVVRIFSQQRVLAATTQILEQNQRELIRLERLSLAGLLTANIFHDIRKPVTNIKHELEDLSDALGGFAGATRALKNMRDQVQLFFDILLDLNFERFVRSDQSDEEYVDVNRVLEQALRLVHYERGSTRLQVEPAADLPLVLAHPYRLVQVFSNIILNAYQALEGRGELKIITRLHPDGPDPRSGHARLQVEIADSGPGIPPEHAPRLFDPFYSTKPSDKGTGMGLYISKMIVEQAGGTIGLLPGPGARFCVTLISSE